MRQQIPSARIGRSATLLGLIFFACCASAQAQLRAFVDCVEKVDNSNYRAYFGYVSYYNGNITYPAPSPDNFFTPVGNPPGQPTIFLPGVHHRAVSVIVPNNTNEVWVLEESFAESRFTPEMTCGADGANSRSFTYQGRLTDGAAAANGQYDLRFQIFTALTGGTARSATLEVENVPVVSGIFTVSLDFGAISRPAGLGTSNTIIYNLGLNPAILDTENTFIEIGVRAGNSTGAYTPLAPRQPITAVPLAMKANTANIAFRAVNAENAVSAASATNAVNATNATNATNVSGGIVQLPLTTDAPPASECDNAAEYGRQKVDAANSRLYICTASGWKFTVLQ